MKHQDITGRIIQCVYKVHNTLGFGFLENVYQNALLIELEKNGLKAVRETPIQVSYEAQLVNYLKATGLEVGLLINFGERADIKRKVLTPSQGPLTA